jgi:methylene-fatty-acyl-phospholipid synthase
VDDLVPALGWLVAALLLSVERVCYIWVARAPDHFRRSWARTPGTRDVSPVDVVHGLFLGFKVLQAAVFLAWCHSYGDGRLWPPEGPMGVVLAGACLVAAGQGLSAAVFYRLGRVGVFYGNRFDEHVPWCREFPFSVLQHPQYVGALLTIWGFFILMRFPHDDWWALPVVETVYYTGRAARGAWPPCTRAGPQRVSSSSTLRDAASGVEYIVPVVIRVNLSRDSSYALLVSGMAPTLGAISAADRRYSATNARISGRVARSAWT